jgi:hypothetical protein
LRKNKEMSKQYREHYENIYPTYSKEEWADFAPLSLDWQREEESLTDDEFMNKYCFDGKGE